MIHYDFVIFNALHFNVYIPIVNYTLAYSKYAATHKRSQ